MRGSRKPDASPAGLLAPRRLGYVAAIFTPGRRCVLHQHSLVFFLFFTFCLLSLLCSLGDVSLPYPDWGFSGSAVWTCEPPWPLGSPEPTATELTNLHPCWKLGCESLESLLSELGEKYFLTRRCYLLLCCHAGCAGKAHVGHHGLKDG